MNELTAAEVSVVGDVAGGVTTGGDVAGGITAAPPQRRPLIWRACIVLAKVVLLALLPLAVLAAGIAVFVFGPLGSGAAGGCGGG